MVPKVVYLLYIQMQKTQNIFNLRFEFNFQPSFISCLSNKLRTVIKILLDWNNNKNRQNARIREHNFCYKFFFMQIVITKTCAIYTLLRKVSLCVQWTYFLSPPVQCTYLFFLLYNIKGEPKTPHIIQILLWLCNALWFKQFYWIYFSGYIQGVSKKTVQ